MDQLQTYRFAPVVNVFVGQRWKIFAYEWDLQINISKLHCLPAVKMLSRMWARRWIKQWSLWRMASAKPNLRLPSQPQGITAPWPVPNYTALWQRHMCVNNLPKVVTWKWNGRESNTRHFVSWANTLTIMPPGLPHQTLDRGQYFALKLHQIS